MRCFDDHYALIKRIQSHATLVLGARPSKSSVRDKIIKRYLSTLELDTSEQIMALVRELFPAKIKKENEGE